MGGWSQAASEASVPSTCCSCGKTARCASGMFDRANDPVQKRERESLVYKEGMTVTNAKMNSSRLHPSVTVRLLILTMCLETVQMAGNFLLVT